MSIFDKAALNEQTGQAALVAGTVAINIPGLTTSSSAQVTPIIPAGTLGAMYKAVCTANTLTITSVLAAGLGVQVLDTSTVNYTVAM